jgi:Carboxypeptidase regulatory-like domain/TonB dependent receptor
MEKIMLNVQQRIHSLLLASVLLLGAATGAEAQQVFGSIFGTVTDPTGSSVNNAKITISDPAKGTSFEVFTNESGAYSKGQLVPDSYKVTIEAAGFSKVISNEIVVQVDQASKFDAALTVGNITNEVNVTAAAPLLQADRADVAQTFSAKEINDLPNIGRNAQSMELLNPGTAKLGWQHATDENPQGSVQMVVNGQLFDSMGYELDGTTNQDPILGIIVINPTFDSLAEIKQSNQNFDAEFEYVGGGVANYSTKSGSNQFHGDVFEYLQLNTPGFTTFAANPFNGGLPAAVYRSNQFGGSIAGPIKKDKLFFFGDAQLNRNAQGGSTTTSVPDALNRTGNFSDWAAFSPNYIIYDPTTGNQQTGQGRTPFPNNTIPASQLSPQALAILKYFPAPNRAPLNPGQAYFSNYSANGNVAVAGNVWDTREDYYINEKSTFFGRYSQASFTESAPGAFGLVGGGPGFGGNYAGSSEALNQSLALGYNYTFSPTLINEVRFGWEKYHIFDVPNGYGTQPATTAGIPGLNLDNTYTSGLPYFNITSPTSPTTASTGFQLGYALGVNSCNCPLTETESQFQFVDNLTKIYGNHTFKVGTDIRYAKNLRVPSDSHRAGELTFQGTETGVVQTAGGQPTAGVGLATFLLGDVSSFARYVSSSTNAMETQPRLFFYAQDTWHPEAKLTVSMGLRYELIPPERVNAAGNGSTLDLSTGLMTVFGYNQNSSSGIQKTNYHDFAPRFGVAYQINQKTVIRAGFGWTYDLGVFGSTFGHNVTQNPPVLSNQNVTPQNPYSGVFTLATGPPALAPVTISTNGTFPLPAGVNPKFRPAVVTLPQTYQFNVAVQRQVTSRIAVSAAYVGNLNRHNFLGTAQSINPNQAPFVPGSTNIDANRPYYSKYGWTNNLSYYCDCTNEKYNSLQATFRVNALQGWTMQGSYTYQRQYGPGWDPYNTNGNNGANYYFLYDRAAGYGYSSTLPRQQWTFAQSYELPIGRGRKYASTMNHFLEAAVGGWIFSGVTTYYSGFPFSPQFGNSYTGQPNTGPNNRPNLGSGDPYAGAQGNRNQWYVGCPNDLCTTGNFLYPVANTFGNYPINTLFGPGFIQQDLSIAKTFRLTEKLGFTLRTDSTNVFNHTNLGLPNNNVDQSNAGQITGLAAGSGGYMRRLQFSGTVRF